MCWQGTNIPHSVIIISLGTSAVTGYPSRCRISVTYSCHVWGNDKTSCTTFLLIWQNNLETINVLYVHVGHTVFWNVMLCSLADMYHQSKEACCLHFMSLLGGCKQEIPYKCWHLSTKLCDITTDNLQMLAPIHQTMWHHKTGHNMSPSILNRTEMFQKLDLFPSSGSYSVWSIAVNPHIYTLFLRYTNKNILMTQIPTSTVPIRPL